jgi:hypothetical protein
VCGASGARHRSDHALRQSTAGSNARMGCARSICDSNQRIGYCSLPKYGADSAQLIVCGWIDGEGDGLVSPVRVHNGVPGEQNRELRERPAFSARMGSHSSTAGVSPTRPPVEAPGGLFCSGGGKDWRLVELRSLARLGGVTLHARWHGLGVLVARSVARSCAVGERSEGVHSGFVG